MNTLRIGLVSISDRASSGVYQDKGIPALEEWLTSALTTPFELETRLIPDEQAIIEQTLCELVDEMSCHLVLTTGGTGPARRDVTPDATLAWVKIANTMKLRMALRLSKRETEAGNAGMNLKAIATEAAQNTLATVNKDILIDKSLENEMWLMFNWGDCGFNANLVTIMSGTKDPRQPLYMTLNTGDIKNEAGTTTVAANSQYLGIRFASGLPAKPNSWGNFSGWIQGNNGSSYSMPLPIMKAAEAYFLLAEAKLRWDIGSESVKNLYENGIRVSMTNELAYRGAYAGIKEYPEGAVDAYINGTSTQIDYTDPIKAELSTPAVNKLSVKWDESASNEEKLERIITQKWLALFPLSTEGWAEQRRTGYPRFFPAFVNESNGAVNTEEGVRRVIYSSQAYDANAKGVEGGIKLLDEENSSKFGISGDKGGTHLWWDNADKGNF